MAGCPQAWRSTLGRDDGPQVAIAQAPSVKNAYSSQPPLPHSGAGKGRPGRLLAAAIRAHIESIFQAFIDKDVAALERTHGTEWRGFMPGSPEPIRGRDGYMNVTRFVAAQPKGQGSVAYRISNFDVVFYGDTAVASFVAETDAAYGAEKTTQKLTLMDVYHKERNGWMQVASSTTSHPDD